jgi:hemerythrin-like domain-containing protein
MAQTRKKTKTGGRAATRSARSSNGRTSPDAVALLKADHRKVEDLFAQLEKTTERSAARRTKLVAQIESELRMHMRLEEDIFYPAFREAVTKKDDKEMYHEAKEEHHVANMVMAELKGLDPADETFGAKAKVLKEVIEHHVEEEEKELFPKSRRAMGAAMLRELGEEMAERKRSLTQMGRTTVGRIARTVINV